MTTQRAPGEYKPGDLLRWMKRRRAHVQHPLSHLSRFRAESSGLLFGAPFLALGFLALGWWGLREGVLYVPDSFGHGGGTQHGAQAYAFGALFVAVAFASARPLVNHLVSRHKVRRPVAWAVIVALFGLVAGLVTYNADALAKLPEIFPRV